MTKPSFVLRPLALLPLAVLTATWAQTAPDKPAEPKQEEPVEEIVVRGERSLLSLRIEVDVARERVYDAFNDNNSDDDLDIHCTSEQLTGRRTESRVCSPVYIKKATAQASKDFVRRVQRNCGGAMCEAGLFNGAAEAQRSMGEIARMNRRLDAEMQRLARENPEVAKAIQDYDAAERAYREALGRSED